MASTAAKEEAMAAIEFGRHELGDIEGESVRLYGRVLNMIVVCEARMRTEDPARLLDRDVPADTESNSGTDDTWLASTR
jgi:hypothetical protein